MQKGEHPTTPMMAWNLLGARPSPEATPPMEGLEDVTKGYVPKSRSSIVALAPSTRMRFPDSHASLMYSTESPMNGDT